MRDEPDLPDALDPKTLSWLAAAFGWPAAATGTLVQRGAMGATYRIETPAGPVAAKRLFDWHPLTEELADWMARFADRCRDAGVPSPRALPGRDGRLLQAADNGARWRCLDWIDGAVPDRLDPQAACWLAEQAAVIHRMAEPVWPEELLVAAAGGVARSRGWPLRPVVRGAHRGRLARRPSRVRRTRRRRCGRPPPLTDPATVRRR